MTWVRRNRLGLILLPVALVLAVLASSSRLVHFWLPYVGSDVTKGTVGQGVHLEQAWLDRAGDHVRRVDVTVHGVARTEVIRNWNGEDIPGEGPKGTQLWRVSLTLAAEPDQVVRGCQLEIEDTRGRRYRYAPLHVTPSQLKTSPCLNPDEEGPEADFTGRSGSASPAPGDQLPRPARWDTVADLVLAGDAEPAYVRIWWDLPSVIVVPVDPGS